MILKNKHKQTVVMQWIKSKQNVLLHFTYYFSLFLYILQDALFFLRDFFTDVSLEAMKMPTYAGIYISFLHGSEIIARMELFA